MEFEENRKYRQQVLLVETAELLDGLKDIYNERLQAEYGKKAKRVSKVDILHNLVAMKFREETTPNETN